MSRRAEAAARAAAEREAALIGGSSPPLRPAFSSDGFVDAARQEHEREREHMRLLIRRQRPEEAEQRHEEAREAVREATAAATAAVLSAGFFPPFPPPPPPALPAAGFSGDEETWRRLFGLRNQQRLQQQQQEAAQRQRRPEVPAFVLRSALASDNGSGDRQINSSYVDRSDWQVTLTIEEYDYEKGTVSGSMRAVGGGGGRGRSSGRSRRNNPATAAAAAAAGAAAATGAAAAAGAASSSLPPPPSHLSPPPSHLSPPPPAPACPPRVVVRTWWTGEVVDNANFSFLSNNHGVSSGSTDLRHWLRFSGWDDLFSLPPELRGRSITEGGGGAGLRSQFTVNGGRSAGLARAPHVYLRIKEEFFVTVCFFFSVFCS